VIALLGNLSRDLLPGEPPRPGGAPFHAARALRRVPGRARLYARCAPEDREALLLPVARLGVPVHWVEGTSTSSFALAYDGRERTMEVVAVGDTWSPDDLPALPAAVTWVHAAPLLRSDFPADTLARLARGRRLSLDGQGLVRVPRRGPLALDADFDPEMLRHVTVLKLAEDEARVLGDPAQLPVREVLVTRGGAGATVYVDGEPTEVPAHALDADPTGAGDGFAAAYVAARAAGVPPSAAARRATTAVAGMLAA